MHTCCHREAGTHASTSGEGWSPELLGRESPSLCQHKRAPSAATFTLLKGFLS